MTPHIESEFKLRAMRAIEIAEVDATLSELGAGCRLAETRHHLDVYLDDAHDSLRTAGIGLRLRRCAERQELTCKTAPRRDGALFVREEHTAPWSDDAPPTFARQLAEPLRHHVEPFVLDRALVPVLRLAVRRELRHLVADGTDQCELAIDVVEAHANGRTAKFQEIELEVIDDLDASEHLAARLCERLPLAHADRDKPSHAASLLGLERPAEHRVEEHQYLAVGAALRARFVAALRESAAAETIARDGRDLEGVHRMRVATRRIRTLLRAFASLWPEAAITRLTAHFREAGRRLGAVRDLDVLLASLPADIGELPAPLTEAGARALELLQGTRDTQRTQLVAWLGRADRLAEARWCTETLWQLPEAPAALQPVAAAFRQRVAAAANSLRDQLHALPPELPPRATHAVRLAAKRTRYLLDEFAAVDELHDERVGRLLTRVQRALGNVCDHEAAMSWLLSTLPASDASGAGRELAGALGGLATQRSRAARRARKRARRVLEQLDRKKVWKRLLGPAGPDADQA